MSTSQNYVDRETQNCHDLLNMANLLLAQEQYSRAALVIEQLREESAELSSWHKRYFRERLTHLDTAYAAGKHSLPLDIEAHEGENIIDLATYRRKNALRNQAFRLIHTETAFGNTNLGHNAVPSVGEDEEGNFIYRMQMPLDAVGQSDSLGMEQLLNIWRTSHYAGGQRHTVPLLSDLDANLVAEMGMLGFVHVIDASAANPADFHVQVYGSRVTLHNGRNFSGMALSDFPIEVYQQAVISDYNTARMTGMPYYHRVVATIDDSRRHYTRLILPFSTDGMRPDRLLVGVRIDNWLVE